MSQTIRQPGILEIARRDGKVTVEALAAQFGVTAQTIRRDLAELDEAGRLTRVHGGAILPSGVANIGYAERRALNPAAKAAIAARVAADIPEDCSLFLNIGTTTEAVARALLTHAKLMVVTNNLNVANILAANPGAEVIVAGGVLRRADGGIVGAHTMRMIEQFKVDIAVIGCSALDGDGDMLDFDVQEVAVSQTILSRARRAFLVADHSKFHRSAPVRIGTLAEVEAFYTDAPPPAALAARLSGWGTRVEVAPASQPE